jgi:hypothetical protein
MGLEFHFKRRTSSLWNTYPFSSPCVNDADQAGPDHTSHIHSRLEVKTRKSLPTGAVSEEANQSEESHPQLHLRLVSMKGDFARFLTIVIL